MSRSPKCLPDDVLCLGSRQHAEPTSHGLPLLWVGIKASAHADLPIWSAEAVLCQALSSSWPQLAKLSMCSRSSSQV
eukprot:CAMPEP_0203939584 /NCGR_PEP_ID=MMETSP0359-20131031/76349_1 /ASSEMBLY_ACC=CAM_ASM_000338 /TAXON_ID=268821 /ORGANISM="Scrippsiella Hangoei, Strain SHTV-5" /LENGTH=76 /DNA_ID=CAMNT_0050869915 /DNA_START=48 /DNA_END=274 /DNA_ORIENTATION=+